MAFSGEMEEIGRFRFRKLSHLVELLRDVRKASITSPDSLLFYPPASPAWIPVLRDVFLLPIMRRWFRDLIFIHHAGGLGEWASASTLRRFVCRYAYGNAALSLEVSKERIPAHSALASRTWAWTPYGVEVPKPPDRTAAIKKPLQILFVGSLQEGKGVIEVLRTASLLKKQGKQKDFYFRVVGRWFSKEFEEDVRHLQAEMELQEMVEFPGQLTGNEKWQAYADADIFFFPTHYASEAFPLVLIEALGSGLPVVTTRWRGIPDLLDGCSVAKLCPVRSPAEYADALLAIEGEAREGTDFAVIARSFYEEKYLPSHFLAQIQSLIGSIAHGLPDHRKQTPEPQQGRRALFPLPVGPIALERGQLIGSSNGEVSDSSGLQSKIPSSAPPFHHIQITAYLADQNPGHDRSFGISRMSHVVLDALQTGGKVRIEVIASKTSQQAPDCVKSTYVLPWGTRRKWIRLLTDHFHPLFNRSDNNPGLHYFPKGYLPLLSALCRPAVVTIHDTIIQYDEANYPRWRSRWEYAYWALMLKHTLRQADRILTVSESSKGQIHEFMDRHRIPRKEITVTYEPCLYERVPQPAEPLKENYVIHLASCEPHKRTAHLIRWWHEAESRDRDLPMLHLIGTVPPEVAALLASSRSIVKRPFLEDDALQAAYRSARALILPSEIEGFGLPALEAYYLGTPVCFVKGTSVEEILGVVTHKGAFTLNSPQSLFSALDEVMRMSPGEVRECGLKLRECYAASKVAERMVKVFEGVIDR